MGKPIKVAILDDYQGVALACADWSKVAERADITVFRDHLTEGAAVVERLKPFDIVCVMRERTPLPRAILEQLPNLKLIGSNALRNAAIDVAAAKERGVTVCATGYSSHGAMEMTWALILGSLRHLPAEVGSLRQGGWQVALGGDLKGATLGVVGLGNIGAGIAAVGRAFGMKVIAWSQNLTQENAEAHGATLVDKETLFRTADIVTLHLVLSRRSRGIVGAAELALMKPTALIVNTSRGPLIDEAALVEALEGRRIAGAALDVFDSEPLPAGHPFRRLDNVLASPHVGFVTKDTYATFYRDTVENILAFLDGKPIRVMER
jgi:phosphoglycerate dehydrogenase-like enzyme